MKSKQKEGKVNHIGRAPALRHKDNTKMARLGKSETVVAVRKEMIGDLVGFLIPYRPLMPPLLIPHDDREKDMWNQLGELFKKS
jgi:hypothetical protein